MFTVTFSPFCNFAVLTSSTEGRFRKLFNNSSSVLKVYPSSGANFVNMSTNAPISLPAYSMMLIEELGSNAYAAAVLPQQTNTMSSPGWATSTGTPTFGINFVRWIRVGNWVTVSFYAAFILASATCTTVTHALPFTAVTNGVGQTFPLAYSNQSGGF